MEILHRNKFKLSGPTKVTKVVWNLKSNTILLQLSRIADLKKTFPTIFAASSLQNK